MEPCSWDTGSPWTGSSKVPLDLVTLCLGARRELATGKSPFSWGLGLSRCSAIHIMYHESVPSLGSSVCSPHPAVAVETGWSTPLHTGDPGAGEWRGLPQTKPENQGLRGGHRGAYDLPPGASTPAVEVPLFSPLRPAIPPPRDNDQGTRLHPQPPRAVIPLRLLSAPAAARPKLPGKRRWMARPSGLKLILHSAPATSPLPGEQ